MSIPENPLAKFNSYTAYHTLIMCDGMRTADALYGNAQIFENVVRDPELLFDVNEIGDSAGGINNDGTGGRYIVLFDGKQDASYFIKSVKWKTVLAPVGARNESKFETIETEGEMIIEEPFGVEFLEVLVKGTRELGVDPSSTVFMLKTYFVGFTANGVQETINDVLPFTFVMTNLTSQMKTSGSLYNITFFGTLNGQSHLPQISSIGNGLVFSINVGDTLTQAVEKLQIALNLKYDVFKRRLRDILTSNFPETQTLQLQQEFDQRYLPVRYKIQIDEEYTLPAYTIGADISHNTGDDNIVIPLKFSQNATVETCIKELFKRCPLIKEESAENNEFQASYTPKIVSALRPPEDDDAFLVEYTVNRYETLYQLQGVVFEPPLDRTVTFDFIYTGNNVDVLNFDIKMDMGLSFFQTQLAPRAAHSTSAEALGANTSSTVGIITAGEPGNVNESVGSEKTATIPRAPLFLGQTISPSSFTTDIDPAAAATFDAALARQAALENIKARITIIGNPNLLNESVSPDTTSTGPVTDNAVALSNLYRGPGYVKVNVSFPSSKDLTGTKQFWYDGFYTIHTIRNIFSDGVFKQELDLFSVPTSSHLPATLAAANLDMQSQSGTNANSINTVFRGIEPTPDAVLETNADDIVPVELGSTDATTARIFYKSGVNLRNIDPAISNTYNDIADIWAIHDPEGVPIITSGNDGTHGTNSLHDINLAIDLRANSLPGVDPATGNSGAIELGKKIARDLSIRLGNRFDVIYEDYTNVIGKNFNYNHIHIEYDPRPRILMSERVAESTNEQ